MTKLGTQGASTRNPCAELQPAGDLMVSGSV